jgi:hypothetical protein
VRLPTGGDAGTGGCDPALCAAGVMPAE